MASISPRTKVELRISCKRLKDKDVLSKSDPLVAVYTYNSTRKTWTEVSNQLQ